MRNFLLMTLFLTACSAQKPNSNPNIVMRAPDFAVQMLNADEQKALAEPIGDPDTDCVNHLRQISCVSNKTDLGFDSTCASDQLTDEMFMLIPDFVRAMPPFHRQVFCHLDRLQIHNNLLSIAYASTLTNSNHEPIGNMIGIRLDTLLATTVNKNIWSWKKQLNFGLSVINDPTYTISDKGPNVTELVTNSNLSVLLSTMVHEVGHMIDFMNHANIENCDWNTTPGQKIFHCTIQPNSFGVLSWPINFTYDSTTDQQPAEWAARYPYLSQFCYYFCVKTIPLSDMDHVYAELRSSSFMTSYSSNSTMEDFAEASTVWSLLRQGQKYKYEITGPQKQIYFSLLQQWNTPQVELKKQWLENFFARTDLIYKITPPPTTPTPPQAQPQFQ